MDGPTSNPSPQQNRPKWHSRRSPHRARSHQEAHAADAADAGQSDQSGPSGGAADQHERWTAIEHPLVPHTAPVMITTQGELQSLITELRTVKSFAYDSEFIGEHSYHPKLCVIQVAVANHIWLIDPLAAGLDLGEFWHILAEPSIEKIVHAGLPDLEPVYRHLNTPAVNVFDSQIAAAFTGLGFPSGLARLVKELTGAELAQGLKFSQWDHRPLSRVQIRYAANDVRYLPLVRSLLMERLEAKNTTGWALEECKSLSEVDLYRFDEQSQRVRVRDIESLRPKQRSILANLIAWRESAARHEDVPARTLLKDGLLVDMARWPPKSVEELNRIKGMPRPVKQHYGEVIISAIARALGQPVPDDLKRSDRQGRKKYDRDRDRPNVEALWKQMHEVALARGIDPAIVTSKKEIARHRAKCLNGEVDQPSRITTGWRRELLGEMFEPSAMKLVHHRGSVSPQTPGQSDATDSTVSEDAP